VNALILVLLVVAAAALQEILVWLFQPPDVFVGPKPESDSIVVTKLK
jgi:beta-lactam-binding protein with PASTA domain